jgi:putative transposase
MENFVRERKRNRLAGYDYSSPGAYFVTICVHEKYRDRNVFGKIQNGGMELNSTGRTANRFWNEIPFRYPCAELDEYCIMPDHIHGIIRIGDSELHDEEMDAVFPVGTEQPVVVGTEQCSVPTTTGNPNSIANPRYGMLSKIIKSFKNAVTNAVRSDGFANFTWQRSFYDRIVRRNDDLSAIRRYIANNPLAGKLEEDIGTDFHSNFF